MLSKHAFIIALLLGAAALIVVLGTFLSIEFAEQSQPYLSGSDTRRGDDKGINTPPRFITELQGSNVAIVELDDHGMAVRTIYSSNLKDQVADFSLFAVPQINYQQIVYVQSIQDAGTSSLIVYPLNVSTGKMSQSVLNITSAESVVSDNQTRVAVITLSPIQTVTIYDLTTGEVLGSWPLERGESLTESASARTYVGDGPIWTSADCVEHKIWSAGQVKEIRPFCL